MGRINLCCYLLVWKNHGYITFCPLSEAHLGLLQHPRWSALWWKSLTIIIKRPILDVAAALDPPLFVISLRYFVDHDSSSWWGILLSCCSEFFFWLRTWIFKTTWYTQIFATKLMKLMQKWKHSPKEFFQLSQSSVRNQRYSS